MLKAIEPQNSKYNDFYIKMADVVAKQSKATRRKVGAVIVMPSGLISVGWNGTPPGFNNECEEWDSLEEGANLVTKSEVIHAERNALDKLTRQGVATEGAILFVTTAPCIECAKSLASVGIKEIHYRDIQSSTEGLKFLREAGIQTFQYK